MAKKKSAPLGPKLNERLSAYLGQQATRKLIEEIDPKLLDQMKAGDSLPKIADLIVHEVVKMALRGKEWAIQLVYDRMEGKTPVGNQARDDGRGLEDKLDGITTAHLNAYSESIIKERRSPDPEAEKEADRRSAADGMDMPADPAGDTQDNKRELVVAQELAPGGHQ